MEEGGELIEIVLVVNDEVLTETGEMAIKRFVLHCFGAQIKSKEYKCLCGREREIERERERGRDRDREREAERFNMLWKKMLRKNCNETNIQK